MLLKEELYGFCKSFVEARALRIYAGIETIKESLLSETKSSAGDKHETGRAMLQLEREKLGEQLKQVEEMNATLLRIKTDKGTTLVTLGSLVRTSKADYFIAISAGEYEGITDRVYCISGGTPIGKLLLGKAMGDVVDFKGEKIRISKIV